MNKFTSYQQIILLHALGVDIPATFDCIILFCLSCPDNKAKRLWVFCLFIRWAKGKALNGDISNQLVEWKVLFSQFSYLFLSVSYKDAVFLSPHKFVGGPGTPGMILPQDTLLAVS